MIDHLAHGAATAQIAHARILALAANARLVTRTLRVQNALGMAAEQRIANVIGHAGADAVRALCIRAAGRRNAQVSASHWFGLWNDFGAVGHIRYRAGHFWNGGKWMADTKCGNLTGNDNRSTLDECIAFVAVHARALRRMIDHIANGVQATRPNARVDAAFVGARPRIDAVRVNGALGTAVGRRAIIVLGAAANSRAAAAFRALREQATRGRHTWV